MFQGFEAEMRGQGLAHIGEARPHADRMRLQVRTEEQHRHVFAGVIGAMEGGIAAVIGGDQRQIARLHPRFQLRQAAIEFLERRGHTLATIHNLPEAEATALMKEASIHASARLSEVDARSHYVHDIHDASKGST